jgi:hypothetical protein
MSRVRERELLIFACSPSVGPLSGLDDEAAQLSTVSSGAAIVRGGTADDLRTQLAAWPTRAFYFLGHADVNLNSGMPTLGFTASDGALAPADNALIAEILGACSKTNGGHLELVVLNGCKSESLGRAIFAGGVPTVICWSTLLENQAGPVFSLALSKALADGRSASDAFEEAKRAVRLVRRDGTLASGHRGEVPKYELLDPQASHVKRDFSPTPSPAGIPVLLQKASEASEPAVEASASASEASEPASEASASARHACYKIHVEDVEDVSLLRMLPADRIGKFPQCFSMHDKLVLEAPSHTVRVDGMAPTAIAAMTCEEAARWTSLQLLHMTSAQLMAITEQQARAVPKETMRSVWDNFSQYLNMIGPCPIINIIRRQFKGVTPPLRYPRGPSLPRDFPPTVGETPDEFVVRVRRALDVDQHKQQVRQANEQMQKLSFTGKDAVYEADYNIHKYNVTPQFCEQFTFKYSELVLVRRSSGDLNYARVVSNANGLHVLEWSVEDVASWASESYLMATIKDIDGATLMSVTERSLHGEKTEAIKDLQELGVPAVHGSTLLKCATALRVPACLFNHGSSEAEPPAKRVRKATGALCEKPPEYSLTELFGSSGE